MKTQKITLGIIFFVIIMAAFACGGSGKKAEKAEAVQEAALIEVSIGGMTCTGCEQTVQANVAKLDGIKSVKAAFTTGIAVIEFYPDKVDTLKIKDAVTGSGYTVKKFSEIRPAEDLK